MRVARFTSNQHQSGSIPDKWGWPDSPQPSSNLINAYNPRWMAKSIFAQNLTSLFIPTFKLSSSTYFFHVLFNPHWTAKSIFPPTFSLTSSTLSSSTCFIHVLFGFLWPSTSKSNALLKTWPCSLLNTWPGQWTMFAIANWSIVPFKPSISIKSMDVFMSLSCTPHIALTMDLSVLCKITISPSIICHACIQYCWPDVAFINGPFQPYKKSAST